MRRLISALLAAFVALGTGSAWGVEQSAQEFLDEQTRIVLDRLREEGPELKDDPERLNELIDRHILPHVDFPRMARFVLGPHWRDASEEQREAFTEAFRGVVVRTYAGAAREYIDDAAEQAEDIEITYKRQREDEDATEVMVRTVIETPGGGEYPVNYRMHSRDGEWKVYDLVIEGVSLLQNYRSTYSSEVRRKGLDAVIEDLKSRDHQPAIETE